ncbi:hypothetical protein D3C81_1599080 [compost metagenome]
MPSAWFLTRSFNATVVASKGCSKVRAGAVGFNCDHCAEAKSVFTGSVSTVAGTASVEACSDKRPSETICTAPAMNSCSACFQWCSCKASAESLKCL